MKIISTLFFIIFIVFFGGIVFLILYVLKKSTEKKSDSFNRQERYAMLEKLEKAKKKLVPWNREFLNQITNSMPHMHKKMMHNEFNGSILSSGNEKILAFRMIDRGLSRDCKIGVCTSEDTYYMEAGAEKIVLYANKVFIGSVVNEKTILDKGGQLWGQIVDEGRSFYSLFKGEQLIAKAMRNSDRREFVKNRQWDSMKPQTNAMFGHEMYDLPELQNYSSMIRWVGDSSEEDNERILMVILFYMIYEGIDFTR